VQRICGEGPRSATQRSSAAAEVRRRGGLSGHVLVHGRNPRHDHRLRLALDGAQHVLDVLEWRFGRRRGDHSPSGREARSARRHAPWPGKWRQWQPLFKGDALRARERRYAAKTVYAERA
jgi:hypothetical protein